jgi:hypothetical protein
LTFVFDESVAGQDRIEQILDEIRTHDTGASGPDETPKPHDES